MHYVISDIHGCYAQFTELLGLIDFKDTDTLYVLGDIVAFVIVAPACQFCARNGGWGNGGGNGAVYVGQ